MNRLETNDKRERLSTVNAIHLGKTKSNQTSLVTCNDTIRMIFEGEDPLARDNVSICWTGNPGPSSARS